jgi:hypothetical protein
LLVFLLVVLEELFLLVAELLREGLFFLALFDELLEVVGLGW